MRPPLWSSVPGISDVELHRGARSSGAPDLLLEVPHGATRAEDFAALRRVLVGTYPDDLRDFFFVNTDVGAPEVATRVAELYVAAEPERCAAVVRCRIPRTFVDCNRVIDADTIAKGSAAGEMTPGLHAWVRDPRDRELLLARYASYRALVTEAFERVCGRGGRALMVHSYAPRSVDVPVDDRIVEHLRAAYAPDRVGTWPLRSPVDLIVDAPDGTRLASPELHAHALSAFAAAGLDVVENGAYALHPSTLAHAFARAYPARTLCLELRRDLLVAEFTPFEEMRGDPAKVERVASALADAAVRAARAAGAVNA
ncbi:MAG: N-formylglutamate amidohydrolase [Planctomycetes bacterium]|nr:N-formylglutamate amidohydrolase [Planctomycetota bacterium]